MPDTVVVPLTEMIGEPSAHTVSDLPTTSNAICGAGPTRTRITSPSTAAWIAAGIVEYGVPDDATTRTFDPVARAPTDTTATRSSNGRIMAFLREQRSRAQCSRECGTRVRRGRA